MDKRIIYKNEDGTLGVIIPTLAWADKLEDLALKDVPQGLSWRIAHVSEIPEDRTFRGAWVEGETSLEIDMEKACEIHMDNIRLLRNKKLEELDVETLKGNDVQFEKQMLRDIPQTLDLSGATTPQALKNLIPDVLK